MPVVPASTADLISARDNDLSATQRVMDAFLPLIDNIAYKLASEIHTHTNDLAEEIAAEGRLALWELIKDYDDESRTAGWIVKRLQGLMIESRGRTMHPEVPDKARNVWLRCLAAVDYDASKAIIMATEELPKRQRISLSAAYAAAAATDVKIRIDASDRDRSEWASEDDTEPDEDEDSPRVRPELFDAVHSTVAAMSDKQAEVLTLHHFDEMTTVNIAEDLGIDPGVAVDRLNNGEKSFHRLFPWNAVYPGDKPARVTRKSGV